MTSLKNKRVFIHFFLVCVTVLAVLSACKGKGNSGSALGNVSTELTIMMWAGDAKYYRDIGSMDLTRDDLTAVNVAAAYATAKEFKKLYPNVKINFYAKMGADGDADGSWEQHRDNFRMQYGVYPDLYSTKDVIGDIQKGLIADLSVFADDPVYKSFNPAVMGLMNVGGRQFALPQYLLPWGIYINKSLAEANNIDIPDPDWNIADFTRFVSRSRQNVFYGSMGDFGVEMGLINTGTQDFSYMLSKHQPGGPFVNLNSDAIRSLLRYFVQWRPHSVWANRDLGLLSAEFMEEHQWWGYRFWMEGKLLTYANDPWMMRDAAHPDPTHWGVVKAADWDIYPRPSTDYMPNTVGIVLDPFVIRNFAMDDGNPDLSEAEKAKLQIAWEFAKFWCGDTRAWEARAKQQYRGGDTYGYALNDSLPMVTGPEFDRQMDIWFALETHRRYADKNKMPGFHYLLELWKKGDFWDVSSNAYPWFYDFEGTRRDITYEWSNAWNRDIVGALSTDPNWLDQVYARLPQWNTVMNQRWETEMRKLEDSLNRYYPR
jgi:ABC-type glycerol-3-phosphate transport system substrate-binding protein